MVIPLVIQKQTFNSKETNEHVINIVIKYLIQALIICIIVYNAYRKYSGHDVSIEIIIMPVAFYLLIKCVNNYLPYRIPII